MPRKDAVNKNAGPGAFTAEARSGAEEGKKFSQGDQEIKEVGEKQQLSIQFTLFLCLTSLISLISLFNGIFSAKLCALCASAVKCPDLLRYKNNSCLRT